MYERSKLSIFKNLLTKNYPSGEWQTKDLEFMIEFCHKLFTKRKITNRECFQLLLANQAGLTQEWKTIPHAEVVEENEIENEIDYNFEKFLHERCERDGLQYFAPENCDMEKISEITKKKFIDNEIDDMIREMKNHDQ